VQGEGGIEHVTFSSTEIVLSGVESSRVELNQIYESFVIYQKKGDNRR
jgi:hypothetical protein